MMIVVIREYYTPPACVLVSSPSLCLSNNVCCQNMRTFDWNRTETVTNIQCLEQHRLHSTVAIVTLLSWNPFFPRCVVEWLDYRSWKHSFVQCHFTRVTLSFVLTQFVVVKDTIKPTLKVDVEELEWPAQSTDLNTTEHLWNKLEHRLRTRPWRRTSVLDLLCSCSWMSPNL